MSRGRGKSLDDKDLIREFLALVEELNGPQVEELTTGIVTRSDQSRWRRGKFERLNNPKRYELLAIVAEPPREQIAAILRGGPVIPADAVEAYRAGIEFALSGLRAVREAADSAVRRLEDQIAIGGPGAGEQPPPGDRPLTADEIAERERRRIQSEREALERPPAPKGRRGAAGGAAP